MVPIVQGRRAILPTLLPGYVNDAGSAPHMHAVPHCSAFAGRVAHPAGSPRPELLFQRAVWAHVIYGARQMLR